jgi:hypothetical protein
MLLLWMDDPYKQVLPVFSIQSGSNDIAQTERNTLSGLPTDGSLQVDLQRACPWLDSTQVEEISELLVQHGHTAQAGRMLQLVVQCSTPDIMLWHLLKSSKDYPVTRVPSHYTEEVGLLVSEAFDLSKDISKDMRKYRVVALQLANRWQGLLELNKTTAERNKRTKHNKKLPGLNRGTDSTRRPHARTLATTQLQDQFKRSLPQESQKQIESILEGYLYAGRAIHYLCESIGYWILAALPTVAAKPQLVLSTTTIRSLQCPITPYE